MAQANAERREINLVASYRLNKVSNFFTAAYERPNNQQRFSIGFSIPLLDWGRRKARYNTARTIEKLTAFNNELEETTIREEITTLVKNLELLKRKITLALRTDSIAGRRYEIANRLYQAGKLTITDLGLAQAEKDNARRNHIDALRQYWDSYYMLRRLTFYDFQNQVPLFTGK